MRSPYLIHSNPKSPTNNPFTALPRILRVELELAYNGG